MWHIPMVQLVHNSTHVITSSLTSIRVVYYGTAGIYGTHGTLLLPSKAIYQRVLYSNIHI